MANDSRKYTCTTFAVVAFSVKLVITVLFVMFFVWITTPKARLAREIAVRNLMVDAISPSFSMQLAAQVEIKNRNFGHFKFSDTNVTTMYLGTLVGSVSIKGTKVRARSSTKMNMTILVNYRAGNLTSDPWLKSDIGKGVLPLRVNARFKGHVHLFLIFFKKEKTAKLKCTMDVDIKTMAIQHLVC